MKAEQDSLQAEQALHDAHLKALDKAGTQMQKQTASLESFGAQLDSDFGVSDGLAGIAENITKFLANLAFAPSVRCDARARRPGSGTPRVRLAGGLAGVLSQSGAFGSQYQVAPSWMRGAVAGGDGASYASAGYGASAGPPLGLTGAGKPYGLRAGTGHPPGWRGLPRLGVPVG